MKKYLLSLATLVISILSFAQDKIILNKGDTLFCKITSVEKDFIILKNSDGGKSKVPIGMVKSYVFGKVESTPNLSGDELINASNSMFISIGISAGSTLISIIWVSTLLPPLIIVGGIGSIVAVVFWVRAWIHIHNAGLMLKGQKL